MMKADGRTKWTSEWSFLPKNVRYDNLVQGKHLLTLIDVAFYKKGLVFFCSRILWTNIPDVGGYGVVDIVRWLVMCSIHLSGSPIFPHFAKQQPNLEVNFLSGVPKGHFTQWLFVERINDSKNLVGGE